MKLSRKKKNRILKPAAWRDYLVFSRFTIIAIWTMDLYIIITH